MTATGDKLGDQVGNEDGKVKELGPVDATRSMEVGAGTEEALAIGALRHAVVLDENEQRQWDQIVTALEQEDFDQQMAGTDFSQDFIDAASEPIQSGRAPLRGSVELSPEE